tara:strand:+ start:780 stop:1364 length:585 start_codon:yes stop_codon:yes gene_type:complete
MNNITEIYEKEQIEKLTSKKRIPAFRAGDTIKVTLKIIEGDRKRLQTFEGVCIARKNNGLNSNFTIRKISHGEGVEKVFPLFSLLIDKIDIVRKGAVRRAKLYYLRDRKGKSTRIVDSTRGEEADQYSMSEVEDTSTVEQPTKEKPKEEQPAADKPKEDKPAEEKPAEEKAKEENPKPAVAEAEKTTDESEPKS